MPSVTVVVSYPSNHPETGEPLKFDMSYYITTHLPMIEKAWAPYGLQSWHVNEFQNPCPLSGQTPPYLVQTTCYFDTLENFKLALQNGSEEAKADVEKFSNVFPAMWVGEQVKTGTLKM
ncbi:uncharacterized protein EI97DRAFT_432196 [Westerdykella ornata]|uniref:EthD domain-containing protein n=1 Tax=Westerdykella ornata TaxID=318751 RepID=A0A6A6JL58_WESOR|nr:uncharacterized protein EI97DRAFT_432196 [Westerdykella ornata]KAF2277321.1 hypothetical protein EI97DRAFT_432196 [Westerdykella ornata]